MFKHLFTCAVALVATHTLAAAGTGTDLLKHVPESTQILLVVNVAEARDSTLLNRYYANLLAAQPDAKAKLAELGVDPIKDIDTVLFAGGGVTEMTDMGETKNILLIVEGRLPKHKLATIPDVVTSKHQGITIYSAKETDAAFVGQRLFFTKRGRMREAIDVALSTGAAKGKNVSASPKAKPLRDLIATTDTTRDAWMTILIPDNNRTSMKQNGLVAESISGALGVTNQLAATLRINTDSPANAKKAVDMLQGMLPQLTQGMGQLGLSKAAKSVSVTQDKRAVVLKGALTEAELATLLKLASPPPSKTP